MNNVVSHDASNLRRLYATAGGLPYRPATYTCIREFTPSFPSVNNAAFTAEPPLTKPVFEPEAPYPRIYNADYKTTLLASPWP